MINKKTLSDLLASGISLCPEGDMYCKFHIDSLCFFDGPKGRSTTKDECPHKEAIKKGEKDGFKKLYTSYGDSTAK